MEEDTEGQTEMKRRMLRELQVQLETLRFFPAAQSKAVKTDDTLHKTNQTREASQCDTEATIDDTIGIQTKQCTRIPNNKRGKHKIQ